MNTLAITPEQKTWALCNVLATIKFTTELTPEEVAKCRRVQLGTEPLRNLSFLSPYYRPSLYLAGKQRLFGKFRSSDIASAIRLSGMLVVYFWPFRQRGYMEEPRLCLSKERALADLSSESAIVAVLLQIQQSLQSQGLLSETPHKPGEVTERRPRNVLVLKEVEKLEKRIAALELLVAAQDFELKRFLDRYNQESLAASRKYTETSCVQSATLS